MSNALQPPFMINGKKCRTQVSIQGTIATATLAGIIDEDIELSQLLNHLKCLAPKINEIHFDLSQIVRINSCGIREWFLLMKNLAPLAPLRFFKVAECIFEQANMIPGLFGDVSRGGRNELISFYAPYSCSKCRTEQRILLEPNSIQYKLGQPQAPQSLCPQCKTPLQFEGVDSEYFQLLTEFNR